MWKSEPLYIVDDVKWYSHFGNSLSIPQNVKYTVMI